MKLRAASLLIALEGKKVTEDTIIKVLESIQSIYDISEVKKFAQYLKSKSSEEIILESLAHFVSLFPLPSKDLQNCKNIEVNIPGNITQKEQRIVPKEKQCKFCGPDTLDNLFKKIYKGFPYSILYQSENFYISIDGYPVSQHHLLIISLEHQLSFSNLDKKYSNELQEIINYLIGVYDNCKDFIIFEHGNNRKINKNHKTFGNSVDHAHLHFIPNVKISEEEIVNYCFKDEKTRLKFKSQDNNFIFKKEKNEQNFLEYIQDDLPTDGPYLFFYFNNEIKKSLCISENIIDGEIPSQYFRKFLSIFTNKGCENSFYNYKIPEELHSSQEQRLSIINNIFKKFKKL